MNTIWTFGDSLTEGFKSEDLWSRTYVKWKGYTPLTYGEIIAEKFGYQLINLGKGGSDNYTIFETFCKNVDKFEKDDIVIIGWSDVIRFRISNDTGGWTSIVPNYSNNMTNITNINETTINEILVNRTSNVYAEEVNNWQNLIKKSLYDIKLVTWTTFNNRKLKCLFMNEEIERIYTETKFEIKDAHFSELGQNMVAQKIINNLLNGENGTEQKLI